MCGDSTSQENVNTLIAENKVDFVFTSPPYNLGVSAQLSGNTAIGKRGNAYESYDDNQPESEWLSLVGQFMSVWLEVSEYVCMNVQSLAGNRTALWELIYSYKDKFCDVAIWDKGHAAPAAAERVMNSVFEFLFFFTRNNPTRAIRTAEFRGTVKNIFQIPPQRHNESAKIHGATFPIQLPDYILNTFTKRGMTIADPFGGSGTTLIACEMTDRKCLTMELDPIYVDVSIQRYCNHTGSNIEDIYSKAETDNKKGDI